MHEKKGTLKTFYLYLTIENICFLMILSISLVVHLTYLLFLKISRAIFTSTYHVHVFTLYNMCVCFNYINSGVFLSDNNFTLSSPKIDYYVFFFNIARAQLWNIHNTHSPSFFLLCGCSIEDIFHGLGAHMIRYQASISFHGDGGYTQLYKRISLRNNL